MLPSAGRALADAHTIGSSVVSCEQPGDCLMRHQSWVLPPAAGRPRAALEVQRRGDSLVPVVTLRGLTAEQAIGAMLALKPAVGASFDDGPKSDLNCGLYGAAIVYAPQGDAVRRTAAKLPAARSVTIRVQFIVPGFMTLPEQQRTAVLEETPQALARSLRLGRRARRGRHQRGWIGVGSWIACCERSGSRTVWRI